MESTLSRCPYCGASEGIGVGGGNLECPYCKKVYTGPAAHSHVETPLFVCASCGKEHSLRADDGFCNIKIEKSTKSPTPLLSVTYTYSYCPECRKFVCKGCWGPNCKSCGKWLKRHKGVFSVAKKDDIDRMLLVAMKRIARDKGFGG